jgi:exodeoxyribonuclease-3
MPSVNMPIKILIWNVNGLRSVLRKRALDWVSDVSQNIICLQEIKARPNQLTNDQLHELRNISGREYSIEWRPAARLGYSGVATFYQSGETKNIKSGIGDEQFDSEGRGSGERVILGGDFNTAHRELDLRNPKQNHKTSGFLPEERAWIDKFLSNGFVDVYRALYPERVQYTWWTYRSNARSRNVGWRLDYFLLSENLQDRVHDVKIRDDILGSDHCPVILELDDTS